MQDQEQHGCLGKFTNFKISDVDKLQFYNLVDQTRMLIFLLHMHFVDLRTSIFFDEVQLLN